MTFPDNIRTALDSNMHDMLSWSILLNFFSKQQSKLSPTTKITIYEKCEDFRNFWNADHIETVDIIRNNGEIVKQKSVRTSLNIDKNTVYPNNIYIDKDILDYLQIRTSNNHNKLTTDSKRDTDSIGEISALAI